MRSPEELVKDLSSLVTASATNTVDLTPAELDTFLLALSLPSTSTAAHLAHLVLARPLSPPSISLLSTALPPLLHRSPRTAPLNFVAAVLPHHYTTLLDPLNPALTSIDPTTLTAEELNALVAFLAVVAPLSALRNVLVRPHLTFLEALLGPPPDTAHIAEVGDERPSVVRANVILALVLVRLADELETKTASPKPWTLDALLAVLLTFLEAPPQEKDDQIQVLQPAIEALSYLTLSTAASTTSRKAAIPYNLLLSLPQLPELAYPFSSLLANLTSYAPLSEHETLPIDPQESRDVTSGRLDDLLALLPLAVKMAGASSAPTRKNAARALLAWTEEKERRGQMLMEGAGKALLGIGLAAKKEGEDDLGAVQALAKLFITAEVCPSSLSLKVIMTHARIAQPQFVLQPVQLPSAVNLLLSPLPTASSLLNFEILLALTNLATLAPLHAQITPLVLPHLPTLLTSPVELLVRASTELICNLSFSDAFPNALMMDGKGKAKPKKEHKEILGLVARLFEHPVDEETQLAAGGALAGLAEFNPGVVWPAAGERVLRVVEMEGEGVEGVKERAWAVIGACASVGTTADKKRVKVAVQKDQGEMAQEVGTAWSAVP